LHLAARKGQTYSTLRLVQAGAKLNIMNESNEAPIQLATDGDHRGIIEVLVDHGAQLNVNRGVDGWSPLYTAAYQGVLETVELFIQNKAPLDSQNSEGWTSLHAAAEQGHLDVVTCLVKNKVKINIQNNQGVTPLYCAVNSNRGDIVTYLLKHGADTNAGKKGGWKPLHAAARKASADIVKQLIEFGADVDEANDEVKGYTPAMIAIARGKSGAQILETIVAEGGAIDKAASNGSTCLHLAAYWGYLDLVKVLVDKGAKLDLKNTRGLTPLDQAAKFGYSDVCEYLAKKMGVPVPKVSKATKQAKKADALIPDLAPTPESLAQKEKESSKDKKDKSSSSSSKKK
jgi:ankyrin repeat protein